MLFAGSRYLNTRLLNNYGTQFLSSRERAVFNLEKCTHYTYKATDTLDSLSYRVYDNSSLGWAILDCNRQYLTELDIKVGDVLLIPPFEEVVKYFE